MSTPSSLFREAIDLNRYSNGVAIRIMKSYNTVILDIISRLKALDPADVSGTSQRLRGILQLLKQSLDTWEYESVELLSKELQGLVELQSTFVSNELKKVLPAEMREIVKKVEVSPTFARAVATVDPNTVNIQTGANVPTTTQGFYDLTTPKGTAISLPNGKTIQKSFRGIAEDQADLFAANVRTGLLEGEAIDKITRRLSGRLQFESPKTVAGIIRKGGQSTTVANHQINTLVRTSVNQLSNFTSQETYKANSEVTDKYRYVATLDTRTSAVCSSLDGKEFPYDDGPLPPQHFNCRSTTVPIIDYAGLGLDPDEFEGDEKRASMNGRVPADTTYGQWLDKQSRATKIEVLGSEKKADYFDFLSNKYGPKQAIRKFVKDDGSQLTLQDLVNRYGSLQ